MEYSISLSGRGTREQLIRAITGLANHLETVDFDDLSFVSNKIITAHFSEIDSDDDDNDYIGENEDPDDMGPDDRGLNEELKRIKRLL